MSYLYKIGSIKLLSHLHETICPPQMSHRYSGCFQTLRCRTTLFQSSFLPFSNVSRDFFERQVSVGGLGFGCDAPLWVHGKALLGACGKAPGSS